MYYWSFALHCNCIVLPFDALLLVQWVSAVVAVTARQRRTEAAAFYITAVSPLAGNRWLSPARNNLFYCCKNGNRVCTHWLFYIGAYMRTDKLDNLPLRFYWRSWLTGWSSGGGELVLFPFRRCAGAGRGGTPRRQLLLFSGLLWPRTGSGQTSAFPSATGGELVHVGVFVHWRRSAGSGWGGTPAIAWRHVLEDWRWSAGSWRGRTSASAWRRHVLGGVFEDWWRSAGFELRSLFGRGETHTLVHKHPLFLFLPWSRLDVHWRLLIFFLAWSRFFAHLRIFLLFLAWSRLFGHGRLLLHVCAVSGLGIYW